MQRSRVRASLSALCFASLGLVALALWLGYSPAARAAGPIVVNDLADTTGACAASGTGACTLRDALTFANADGDESSITFSVSGTLTLTAPLPAIASPLTLDGGGAITVSGASTFTVLAITSGTHVNLLALTITDGFDSLRGGGILNAGTLMVTGSTFISNTGGWDGGGGIANFGAGATLIVVDSAFISNTTLLYGGGAGIANSGGLATVISSTFTGNVSSIWGAGIHNSAYGAVMTVSASTFIHNLGSGIKNDGKLTVFDSAFISNTSGDTGGGIFNYGTLDVSDSTFISNSAYYAGGGGIGGSGGAIMTITHSTFIDNFAVRSGGGLLAIGERTTVADSTFIGNRAGAYDFLGFGGGIYSSSWLTTTVIHSTFISNTARNRGGGFYNSGALALIDSIVISNTAADGGGLYNDGFGTMNVTNSTLVSNTAANNGGGLYNSSTLAVSNSTFTGNTAAANGGGLYSNYYENVTVINSTLVSNAAVTGGGIYNEDTLTIINSTFSRNGASEGGGLFNITGTVTMTNASLVSNTAVSGGGIFNSGALLLQNTLLAGSLSGGNCAGPLTADSFNLADDATCASAQVTTTAALQLGPLQDNGGSTWTIALGPGSAAIDAGDNTVCPADDQRGYLRLGLCDVGAYEAGFRLYLPLIFWQP